MDADVIVVGAGLAGLVAAAELLERGRSVLIVDQENEANIGGQAFWSFGGLFFVDSAEQRRVGIRDSYERALEDWLRTAGFDRSEDHWPEQWARAYVDFASGEKRSWLRERGLQTFALVGWAERGGWDGKGPGNSVPRFHITWGTGPALVDVFARRVVGHGAVHRDFVDASAGSLQCVATALAGSDANHGLDRRDPHLAVTDLAGPGGLDDHVDDLVHGGVVHHDLDADLGYEVDRVLGAAIDLGVTLLAAVALDLTHGHAQDAGLLQPGFDILERERLDDCSDQLH